MPKEAEKTASKFANFFGLKGRRNLFMYSYDFLKDNIDKSKDFAEELDVNTLNKSANKARDIHISFIHNYSELTMDIERITKSLQLSPNERDELLNEIASTLRTLTLKLKGIK